MNFGNYLRISSLLLILIGFSSILITGSYPIAVSLGILVALIDSYFGERLTKRFPVPKPVWNGIALVLLAYFIFDTFWGTQDLIGNGIKFVVYLQIVKLLSPKTNRDQMQIYLLSFLHLLSSTVVSSDISFVVPFLLYIVIATWTLTMFNLKLQQEGAARTGRKDFALRRLFASTDVITRPYLLMTSLLSLSIIAFTMLIFFLFPRFSMGHFFKRVSGRQAVSGFSENVELGTIGNIKTNETVALRVEIAPEYLDKIEFDRLYWRGTAADNFDGKSWTKTYTEKRGLRVDADTGVLNFDPTGELYGQRFTYRVFLEPMSTPIVFGADKLYRITWEKAMLERLFRGSVPVQRDAYSGIHFVLTDNYISDLTYIGESMLGEPEPALLRNGGDQYPEYIRDLYLETPSLDPRVEELLRGIPVPDTNAYDRAVAIQRYIEKNYRYTLEVGDAGVSDPLKFFLIDKKRGHCEYFSTALAIALRVHKIPARQVMGFRGGEPNPFGRYIAVKQSDAHTWVEVYFPNVGWVRFDPSPLDSSVRFRIDYFRKLNQYLDYLRLRWNKYILEYDLQSQASIVEKIGRSLAGLGQMSRGSKNRNLERDDEDSPQSIWRFPKNPLVVWSTGGVCLLFFGSMVWLRRRRQTGKGRLREIELVLNRYGYRRRESQTPLEWKIEIEKSEGEIEAFNQLVGHYNAERFGRKKISSARWAETLAALERHLSRRAAKERRKGGLKKVA